MKEFNVLDSISEAKQEENLKLVLQNCKRMREIGGILQVDSLLMRADYLQATTLSQLGAYSDALKLGYDNLKMAERQQNLTEQFKFSFLIGIIYQSMEDMPKSLEFIQQAKQQAVACGHYLDTIRINYEIAFNRVTMGEEMEGIEMLKRNLALARHLNRAEDILLGIDNLCNLLAAVGNDQEALAMELELLKMPHIWNTTAKKTAVYEHLAELYITIKDWGNAQKYQREAFKFASILASNDWLFECYKLQSMIDEGRGNYKSALENHQRYLILKDSVYQVQYQEKMAAMSALYELESKQKTIELLNKDAQIQQDALREQQILFLVGVLCVSIILLLLYFFNQRKMHRLRQAFAQDLIKVQEEERQHIAKELHDSVGQNILFIKNHLKMLGNAPDSPLAQCVDSALEEVRNIAKNLYPNQLEHYGLSAAVDSLCDMVRESSGVFASSDLQEIEHQLSREAKINCYRIIQECINNTLKHAGASAIRITSSTQPGKIELVVQDNGRGFDKSLLEQKSVRSFGLLNIQERIRMLRGQFDLETAASKGVKLTFVFPV